MPIETRMGAVTDRAAPDDCVWFRLVTPRRDDHRTVILPQGARLERHQSNPIWLWMHSSGPSKQSPHTPPPTVVVGRVVEYDRSARALDVRVQFDAECEVAQQVLGKIRRGFIRACSVGFDPLRVDRIRASAEQAQEWVVPEGEEVVVISEWELLEGSTVIIGSNREALALRRALAALPTLDPDAETFPERRTTTMPKMTGESRWMHRLLIGHSMDQASLHMRAMEHAPAAHMDLHRAAVADALKRAQSMATQLREAAEEDEPDGDEMRAAARVEARSAPEKAPADVREQFAAVAAEVQRYDIRTTADVCRDLLGDDHPDVVNTKITAAQGTQQRYRALREERTRTSESVTTDMREAKIKELSGLNLMPPAHAERARKERWTLAALASYEAEARADGPPVEIVRTRPLNPVDARATPAADAAGARLDQPETPARQPGQGRGRGDGDDAAGVVAEVAKQLGIDPQRAAAAYARQQAIVSGDFRALRDAETHN